MVQSIALETSTSIFLEELKKAQKYIFIESDGFVQPYSDSPVDNENVGEHVYLQIINNAKDYVYICTPYLIVDDSMVSAFRMWSMDV